jgi:hypothetical protein
VVSVLGGRSDGPATFRPHSQLSWSPDDNHRGAPLPGAGETAREASGIYLLPVDGGEPLADRAGPPPDRHPAFAGGRSLAYAACAGQITPPCDVHVIELGDDYRPVMASAG